MSEVFARCNVCLGVSEIVGNIGGRRKICRACSDRIEQKSVPIAKAKEATVPKESEYRPIIEAILDKIEEKGEIPIPALTSICKEAGCSVAWFSFNLDLRDRYHQIRKGLLAKTAGVTEEPQPTKATEPTAESDAVVKLEQALAQKEAEVESLRKALGDVEALRQEQAPQDSFLDQLLTQREEATARIKRIEAEFAELERDRKAAIGILAAIDILIASHTGEPPKVEFAEIRNGNGNGKLAGVN